VKRASVVLQIFRACGFLVVKWTSEAILFFILDSHGGLSCMVVAGVAEERPSKPLILENSTLKSARRR
jgi:hypothetical protein